jgi:hypothetical protein
MKHDCSKATLARAERLARKNSHLAVTAVIGGGQALEPEKELFGAAIRGDENTIYARD